MLSFNRKIYFSSAYCLYDSSVSESENQRIFGEDYGKLLAASFELQAQFVRQDQPPLDPITGMIVNLPDVDSWCTELVNIFTERPLHHIVAPNPAHLEEIARFASRVLIHKIAKHDSLSKVRLNRLSLEMQGGPKSAVLRQGVTLTI